MTRPLSNDLRRWVVTAVVDGDMSRRGAEESVRSRGDECVGVND